MLCSPVLLLFSLCQHLDNGNICILHIGWCTWRLVWLEATGPEALAISAPITLKIEWIRITVGLVPWQTGREAVKRIINILANVF